VPGSSAYLERAWVPYANRAKVEALGLADSLIERHGAVSEEVARAMAEAARERANVDLGVAVTGIAGPTGGTPDKPVGPVFIASRRPCATCDGCAGRACTSRSGSSDGRRRRPWPCSRRR